MINSISEITEIGNKPSSIAEVKGQYMGLLKITPQSWGEIVSVLSRFPSNVRDKIDMTSTLQTVIKYGKIPVLGIAYEQEWGELDSQLDLEKLSSN